MDKKKTYIIIVLGTVVIFVAIEFLALLSMGWYYGVIHIISEEREIEDFDVSKSLVAMEEIGEKHMREETKLDLFYRVAKGDEDAWDRLQNLPKSYNVSKGIEREDIWGEIERLESEVSSLERQKWQGRKERLRLRAIQQGIEIGDKIILFSAPAGNLSLRIEKERKHIEAVNEKITTKKSKLKILREQAREGKDVWCEIESLRAEIKDLKRELNYEREKLFRAKLLKNLTEKSVVPQVGK